MFQIFELDVISSYNVNLAFIYDMTVMCGSGMIVVSSQLGALFQLSLKGGHLIQKQIASLCQHHVYLLCVQVAGREFLALSCGGCNNIKLMNFNRQVSFAPQIQFGVITAFRGEMVDRMCHGEEKRIFAQVHYGVLELDISTTTFTKLRSISIGWCHSLCYVADPLRLLVVKNEAEVLAVSSDDNKVVWKIGTSEEFKNGVSLYLPNDNTLLFADWSGNRIHIVDPVTGRQIRYMNLPYHISGISGLCWFEDQIVVRSGDVEADQFTLSFFSLKKN